MRVLELSDAEEAAAYGGMLFVRAGAAVTRVEPAHRREPNAASALYLHRGKRIETLDLESDEGRAALAESVADADLVLCDLPSGDADRVAGVIQSAPVCAFISPFGRSGPRRDARATASTLLALGGYTFLSGDPGRAPLTLPGNYAFYQAGSFAYIAALSEHLRGATEPVVIDVSVLETLATLHQFTDTMWTFGGIVRSRHGNRWENLCPTTLLPCEDGWVAMNILPNFWEPFALWVGGIELVSDPRFATNEDRMEHQDELEDLIIEFFSDQSMRELFRTGQETWRVPIGYAPSVRDALEDPHLRERGFWEAVDRPDGKTVFAAGSPFRFAEEGEVAPDRADDSDDRAQPLASASQPLAGMRVVDLTRIWSGPLATRILGDLGAEVIKVEAPMGRGPRTGRQGAEPPAGASDRPWNRQPLFNKLNRNKKSVALDLKSPEGKEALLRLVAESDVVIENFSARAMPGLGLGYDVLREANPAIIYVPMPALGSFGPYRDYIGLGPSIEPLSGLTALMGYGPDEPRVTAQAITDAAAGVTAAVAVLAALLRREQTGRGARLDLSQAEAMSAYLGEFFLQEQMGEPPRRVGNAHVSLAPHGVYRCAGDDDWIAIAVTGDEEWLALARLADQGWEHDPRFETLAARRSHASDLDELIEAWTTGFDKMALMDSLLAAGIAAGAVQSAPELQMDPQLLAREYFAHLSTPDTGRQRYDGLPIEINEVRDYNWWCGPPGLGEHNREVLGSLGYSDAEIDALATAGIVVEAPPE